MPKKNQFVDEIIEMHKKKSIATDHSDRPFGPFKWKEPEIAEDGQQRIENFFAMRSAADLDAFKYEELSPEEMELIQSHRRQREEREAKRQRVDTSSLSSSSSPSANPESERPLMENLDTEQRRAVEAALNGRNIMITGGGGNGKSYTLRVLVAELQRRGRQVAVTSSTGRSAVSLELGATTLHHFMALGDTGTKDVAHYVKRLTWKSMSEHLLTMRAIDVLIVDEVSMVSAQFLDKMSAIMAAARRTEPSRPWGGAQVIFSGDFAQLLPIHDRQRDAERPRLAFTADIAWKAANVEVHHLGTSHRQSNDQSYAEILGRARFGRLNADDVQRLQARVIDPHAGIEANMKGAMLLFSTNRRVDEHNQRCMQRLDSDTRQVYRARIQCSAKAKVASEIQARPRTPQAKKSQLIAQKGAEGRKWLRENMRAVPELELRLQARVLLLANLDQRLGLVNGSMGTVVGFVDQKQGGYPIVRFDRGDVEQVIQQHKWTFDQHPSWEGTYEQVPLMLAYACTIHRSQGLTVDRVVADLSADEIRDPGMAYVVLSRVRQLEHIAFRRFSPATVFADAQVRDFYGVV